MLEKCLMEGNLKKHKERFFANEPHPWCLEEGAFHCLFNKYDMKRSQGISFHDDRKQRHFADSDPICSITFDYPGILLARRKLYKQPSRRAECTLDISQGKGLLGDAWAVSAHVQPLCSSKDKTGPRHSSQWSKLNTPPVNIKSFTSSNLEL